MRVAIVGAGIMGLSTAWALVRRGHEVEVYDQAAVPNPHGSSVDRHRVISHAYGAEAGFTPMVDDAYAAWDQLWRDLGEQLYVERGLLAIARRSDGWACRSFAALATLGLDIRTHSASDFARLFPALDPRGVLQAFALSGGGALLADRIIERLVKWLGACVRPQCRVIAVDPERGWLALEGADIVAADTIIVAAGPWVARLLPDYAARIAPSRQVVVYVEPPAVLAAEWQRMPVLLDLDLDTGFYAVPPIDGMRLKLADHRFTLRGDPDEPRVPDNADAEPLLAIGHARLAGFERYRFAEARICFYDVAPDERFIVEPIGARGWVMTGFSGHGFKFGPLLGEKLADTLAGMLTPAGLRAYAGRHQPESCA